VSGAGWRTRHRTAAPARRHWPQTESAPSFAAPPAGRTDLVLRRGLLARLAAENQARVVLIVAPAGSGKTTLLRQWATENARPACWVDAAGARSDPVRLVRAIAGSIAATNAAGPVAEASLSLRGTDALRAARRLVGAMADEPRAILLLIDNLPEVADRTALDVVATIVDGRPGTWRIGLASRSAGGLPVARWRLAGDLLELGLADLALDAGECGRLLDTLGVEASVGVVHDVHDRTEGWAAGVYLAGLALAAGHGAPPGSGAVAGDDEAVRDYLEAEVLANLSADERRLLVLTSVVDELGGPIADAITGTAGSAARLAAVARTNRFVIPVDGGPGRYRCHALLRDLFRRLLEEAGPDAEHEARRRAAAWYESDGRLDEAAEQALLAGDPPTAARIVATAMAPAYRAGRIATIDRWIASFSDETLEREPRLTITAALFGALDGDPLRATRLAALALRPIEAGSHAGDDNAAEPTTTADDGPDRALLRAVLCRTGPEAMVQDAEAALAAHDDGWSWRPVALLAAGSARVMLGDDVTAAARFVEAEQAPEIASSPTRLSLRAERALAAIADRRWAEAGAILALDRVPMNADPDAGRAAGLPWLVADARLAIHRGGFRAAQERLGRVQAGRPWLTWAVPWHAVRTLTELARAQLLVGDARGALVSLVQARETLEARPRLGRLATVVEDLTGQALGLSAVGLPGGSTLTPAELRLLPLLQTYLTFKEIGERLGVSGNTVKTEAMSIYAKLGAASRSEAVTNAIAWGLLEDIFA
jgi:LuxR family maltose regulon positive regulatory protein